MMQLSPIWKAIMLKVACQGPIISNTLSVKFPFSRRASEYYEPLPASRFTIYWQSFSITRFFILIPVFLSFIDFIKLGSMETQPFMSNGPVLQPQRMPLPPSWRSSPVPRSGPASPNSVYAAPKVRPQWTPMSIRFSWFIDWPTHCIGVDL